MQKFNIINEPLRGLKVLELKPMSDERGCFQRLYCAKEFSELSLAKPIVNINHSMTIQKGTIRGMHFQYQPNTEIKIVKCIKGSIYDVAIDIRKNSPTFLQYFGIELSERNSKMLYIPEGFAHGFQTLEDNSEIIYFVSNYYSKEQESELNPFDKSINISWPLACTNISNKDKNAKLIKSDFRGIEC